MVVCPPPAEIFREKRPFLTAVVIIYNIYILRAEKENLFVPDQKPLKNDSRLLDGKGVLWTIRDQNFSTVHFFLRFYLTVNIP
jgi:hypothetical protein